MTKKNTDGIKGLSGFDRKFPDEAACIEHLIEGRWHGHITCPFCEHDKIYNIKRRRFKCAKCRKIFSATTGSMYHRSKISLRDWYKAQFYIAKSPHMYNCVKLADDLGISQDLAWFIMMKISEILTICKTGNAL